MVETQEIKKEDLVKTLKQLEKVIDRIRKEEDPLKCAELMQNAVQSGIIDRYIRLASLKELVDIMDEQTT